MPKQFVTKYAFFVIVGALSLRAQVPVDVRWQDVCHVTENQRLTITKTDGANVEGYCISVTANEILLRTEHHQLMKIARGGWTKISAQRGSGHELRTLHRHVHGALRHELGDLLTESGPLQMAAIPPTLAWGIAAAPFCALGDLRSKIRGAYEIRVM